MKLPYIPKNLPLRDYGLICKASRVILSKRGWTVTGELPTQSKCILAVAPHTSNWDFFVAIGVMFSLQLKISFLGKDSIFRWPVNSLLRSMGGIPVERSHAHGVVGQIVEKINASDKFLLGLSPEGTRSKVKEWKTGFLYMAQQANIPVVPISFDFAKKEVHFFPARYITKTIPEELASFKALFNKVCAKNPQSV